MTRDDIIRMAREAGAHEKHLVMYMDFDDLERFAALVEAAEREACAKVCDTFKSKTLGAQSGQDNELSNVMLRQIAHLGHAECASSIRARSTP